MLPMSRKMGISLTTLTKVPPPSSKSRTSNIIGNRSHFSDLSAAAAAAFLQFMLGCSRVSDVQSDYTGCRRRQKTGRSNHEIRKTQVRRNDFEHR